MIAGRKGVDSGRSVERVIRTFLPADAPAAAALLVARHAEHRTAQPLLAPLSHDQAEQALPVGDGFVAVENGTVVGYLIGTSKAGAAWGPNAWVDAAGCAGSRLKELYAEAARGWVAEGRTAHYALVPPALAPTFFELAFGVQQVHAARPIGSPAADTRIRRAERRDTAILAQLDVHFEEHFRQAPIFSALEPSTYDEHLAEWEQDFDEEGFEVFVAEVDGNVLGYAIGCDISKSSGNAGLLAPERAAHLATVSVLPQARGLGLGRALGEAVASWAAAAGYPTLCTDWRSANLEADRAWRALGYEPTFLRLHRHVGF